MKALIHNLDGPELERVCADLGQPAFRARQVRRWLYTGRAASWRDMTNLPASLRERLAERFEIRPAVLEAAEGTPGETQKLLLRLADGECVEIVLITAAERGPEAARGHSRARRTVCVSSQVGCRLGCTFCASGQAGWSRHLEPGEIVGQVLLAWEVFGERPTHVVLMGIGEPFDNYDAVLKALRLINDPDGMAVGARRITVSTCGLVPGIRRFAREALQVELSVSLHAPSDELRSRLMPVNRSYPLSELIPACRDYTAHTRRIVTFEYVLIRDLNDHPQQARALARLLEGFSCRVNLIPLSPVKEFSAEAAPAAAAERFRGLLQRSGINATLRASRGTHLRAGCGQLRARA